MQRSFLKWVGGKYSALDSIFKDLPREGRCLVEPFMGSSTVSLNTDYEKYILNDTNSDLVFLCEWITKNTKEAIEFSKVYFSPKFNNEKTYYQLRDKYNLSKDKKERAAIFLYLNRHGHKGLSRYNKSGIYNVPYGWYKNPRFPEQEILFYALKFKNARFVCGGFQDLKFNRTIDLNVYSDPPYLPFSKTASFSEYSQKGFKKEDHLALDKKSCFWSKGTGGVWVSNHSVPLIEDCYPKHLSSRTFLVNRTIAGRVNSDKSVMEILMKY